MRENTERWLDLCQQAAFEQDPEKLLRIVEEINRLLEEKERRLGILRGPRLVEPEKSDTPLKESNWPRVPPPPPPPPPPPRPKKIE